MKWLVTLKRIWGEQIDTLQWSVDDAETSMQAKEIAENEALEEEITDFFAESAEALIE